MNLDEWAPLTAIFPKVIFAAVVYSYIGSTVSSPAFSSLPPKWMKAAYGIAIPNFLIAGSLYSHTAAKLFFVRLFRTSVHLHEHTLLGWGTWTVLIILMNGAAFVLAVGVPVSVSPPHHSPYDPGP
jgi:hypothetical protein